MVLNAGPEEWILAGGSHPDDKDKTEFYTYNGPTKRGWSKFVASVYYAQENEISETSISYFIREIEFPATTCCPRETVLSLRLGLERIINGNTYETL